MASLIDENLILQYKKSIDENMQLHEKLLHDYSVETRADERNRLLDRITQKHEQIGEIKKKLERIEKKLLRGRQKINVPVPSDESEGKIIRAFDSLIQHQVLFLDSSKFSENIREEIAQRLRSYINEKQKEVNKITKSPYQIVVLGSVCIDLFTKTSSASTVEIYFGAAGKNKLLAYPLGSKILMEEPEFHIGGGGANVSTTFARLGFNTTYIGRVGADIQGFKILEWFCNNHIIFAGDISGDTDLSVILHGQADDETILTYKDGKLSIDKKILEQIISTADWLFGAPIDIPNLQVEKIAFTIAKEHNVKTVYRPSTYVCRRGVDNIKEILDETYVLILNKENAEYLVGKAGKASILAQELLELLGNGRKGPRIITISDAVNGATVCASTINKQFHIKPDPNVDIIDTTGAGDAFASGFIAGLIGAESIDREVLEKAARMGTINAECVIRGFGANEKILYKEEMETKLKESSSIHHIIEV